MPLNRHVFAAGSADAEQSPGPEHDAVCQDVRGLHDCGRHVRRGLPVPCHAHPVGARAMPHAATCLSLQSPGAFSAPAPLFRGLSCAPDCPPQSRGSTPCAVIARTLRSAGGGHGRRGGSLTVASASTHAHCGTLAVLSAPALAAGVLPAATHGAKVGARWSRDRGWTSPRMQACARGRSCLLT